MPLSYLSLSALMPMAVMLLTWQMGGIYPISPLAKGSEQRLSPEAFWLIKNWFLVALIEIITLNLVGNFSGKYELPAVPFFVDTCCFQLSSQLGEFSWGLMMKQQAV